MAKCKFQPLNVTCVSHVESAKVCRSKDGLKCLFDGGYKETEVKVAREERESEWSMVRKAKEAWYAW